jgi:hypothetical protein
MRHVTVSKKKLFLLDNYKKKSQQRNALWVLVDAPLL